MDSTLEETVAMPDERLQYIVLERQACRQD
jgi:hypothetical protein